MDLDVRAVKATPNSCPIAAKATNTGRALVEEFSPKAFLKRVAAMVRSEERNSSRETPAN